MKTRTNEQVIKFCESAFRKYDGEKFYTALYNYWIRWNLTDEQNEILEAFKRRS